MTEERREEKWGCFTPAWGYFLPSLPGLLYFITLSHSGPEGWCTTPHNIFHLLAGFLLQPANEGTLPSAPHIFLMAGIKGRQQRRHFGRVYCALSATRQKATENSITLPKLGSLT